MGKKFNNLDYKHYFLFAFALLPQFLVAQTCPGLGSITLNVVAPPAPTLNFASQLCAGSSTTISVNQSFSTYNWSIGGNGQSITVNGPGNYTVTVTNSGGCTATAVANIQANTAPTPNVTANPYACNGSFVLNAGSGFSTYAWSNGGGSAATASFNSSGTYTVTVTNSFGCTGTDDFNVTIPTPPAASITGTGTFCSGTGTALTARVQQLHLDRRRQWGHFECEYWRHLHRYGNGCVRVYGHQ
jgi:hypothetical protein